MLSTLLALALAASPTPNPRVMTMQGDARLTFKPNQALATFSISASHRDQTGVKKASDEKLTRFLKACREAGVEARNTTINDGAVTPEYRGNEVVGHILYRSVILTITDMSKLDEALTAAVRNGGTPAGPVILQNTDHLLYETKVRIAAATVARERAKGVIEALGAKLGLPSSVSDRTPTVETVSAGGFSVPVEGPVVTAFANRELVATSQVTVQFDVEAP